MAELAFWLGALLFIYGGVDVLRKGFRISEGKVIKGGAGTFIGIALIVLGIGVGIGASLYLRLGP